MPVHHQFFTNCDLVKRDFHELSILQDLNFEYVIDTTSGKRISPAEMLEVMRAESVQTSQNYHNFQNNHYQNHQQNKSPPFTLFIYDQSRLGRKGKPTHTPPELPDHQQLLCNKLNSTDFTREIETLKSNLFNTNDDRRYKHNSYSLAEEIKNIDQELIHLIQGKHYVLKTLEQLLLLISNEAAKFHTTNQQLKSNMKTYNLPQTADFFNDTQLTISLLENIPIDEGEIVNSLLNYLSENLMHEQFYPAPIGEINDYFTRWHTMACGYSKNEVNNLVSRDLWAGIQERLRIPLSCSMENAVDQNLRHIKTNLDRFSNWGFNDNISKKSSSIPEIFKSQLELQKSIKAVIDSGFSSIDKIYLMQKKMLENHDLIVKCFFEFRDLSIDLYKQVDLIIELYKFLDSAYEEMSELERARSEYDFIIRGSSFFQSLLSYPQVILTSALVPEEKREQMLNYCNMPNCLKILFMNRGINSGSSGNSEKFIKIDSRKIFEAVSETVKNNDLKTDFGDGLMGLIPKEFQIEAIKNFATSTIVPSTVDTSCCTSLHVQNKQVQTEIRQNDKMNQIGSQIFDEIVIGSIQFLSIGDGNGNEKTTQTSFSIEENAKVLRVVPISTVSVIFLIALLSVYVQILIIN